MKISLVSLFIIVVFITSCTKQASVQLSNSNTTNVKFSISSKGIFEGELLSFTNESNGIKSYEWSDNDSIFDTKVEPSKRAFTKGIHVIKLVGIDLNGTIYKFLDTLRVYDQFEVQEFKITNKSNIVFPIDTNKGIFLGFVPQNVPGIGQIDLTYFYYYCNNPNICIGLDWDSSINVNSKFTNNFHKVIENRMGQLVNRLMYSSLWQDILICFYYHDFIVNNSLTGGSFYNQKISYVKSINNGYGTLFENSDFLIELKGKPSY